MNYTRLEIYTDGGARGNPGPAGIGVVIWSNNNMVSRHKEFIGHATNNQAEYRAAILGLEEAKKIGAKELVFYLDSELVVNQLKRKYKVKDAALGSLFVKAWNLIIGFQSVDFQHIPREKNIEADKLVNQALDEKK